MNLHIRAATLEDTPAIDALLTAYAIARQGRLPGAGAALDRLTRPESVLAVVQDAQGIVGFGQAWPAGQAVRCFARVHPGHVGRGVGTLLLGHLEAEARRFGRQAFNVMQPATDTAAADLLTARGYEVICRVLRMEMSLEDHHAPAAKLPDGVELTSYGPGNDDAGCSLFQRERTAAQASSSGTDAATPANWQAWTRRPSNYGRTWLPRRGGTH
ncbi:GNAT family N-acetyltransferase [Nonomuraea sp. NPDC049784]|uniref:GNAT family N-acetyltransferase n=1 Tax=Nonomuraea sp. NPDC049784 TaxID=3154361 RepID=UPI00340A36F8